MTAEDFIAWRNVAVIPCIIAALWSLFVILCREWVKSDLHNKIFQPISIRWRFFASTRTRCAFRVIYSDFHGRIHQARCYVYWHSRSVTWYDDEIIGYEDEPVA